MKHPAAISVLLVLLASPVMLRGQEHPSFDVSFRVNTDSAEELLNILERRSSNITRFAELPGTQLASATSLLLARASGDADDFRNAVEQFRDGTAEDNDRYGLSDARAAVPQLRALLTEVRRRQLDRRVRATLASYFPANVRISATIPVYVVAFGNEKAAAFVRRVVWSDNRPEFVSENQGEPVIVLNLTRCLYGANLEHQFLEMLSVLAHECFHAAYSLYQQGSSHPPFDSSPLRILADLVQNEGIAYHISMQIRIGSNPPPQEWSTSTGRAVAEMHRVFEELISPGITPSRVRELILNSNLSGSFEGNYGATAGLRIAYEISTQLGHQALVETIAGGTGDFFTKYNRISRRAALPQLSPRLCKALDVDESR